MKKLWKILLPAFVLCVCFLLLPAKAGAASESDLAFELNSDGNSYSVLDCVQSASGELVIPSTYNGKPVTHIGDWAFFNCNSLTSVTIPDSVTSIGRSAFSGCSSLTGIWVDENNPNYSSDTYGVLFNKEKTELIWAPRVLTEYVIPDSVTSIGSSAFYDCSSLTSVTIPDSVTSIGTYAFYGCSSLTGIWVDDNNPNYSSDTYGVLFNKEKTELICAPSAIVEYVIPDSVTSIGEDAFSSCNSLTSITIPDSVTSIGRYAFRECNSLTSIIIPDGVTSISDSAFCDCSSLTSITIPNSVTSIGDNAFNYCSKLANITIPDSVTSIGEGAFWFCSRLTSVTIGNSVTRIDYYAFCNCSSLTSITIPNSVTSIGHCAFSNCNNLTGIWVEEDNPNYSSDGHGVLFNKNKTRLIQAPGTIAKYEIPNSVTGIDWGAFYNCSNLASVTIKNSVTSIGSYAFYNCSSLTSITIPDSVTSIGGSAFQYCSSLTSIAIPDSVTSIGNGAFYGCSSLEYNIYDNAKYLGNENNPYLALIEATSTDITSCNIHSKAKVICDSAFEDCSSLTNITIPDSVTSIDSYAFYNCSSLTDVYYDGKQGQWNSISVSYGNSCLTNAILHICVESGTCGEDLTWLLDDNGVLTISGTGAMANYRPNNSPFYNHDGIRKVIFQNGVNSIGSYALENCSNLTSITIPDSMREVGGFAFEGCEALTEIYISDLEAWLHIWGGVPYSGADNYYNHPLLSNEKPKNLYLNGTLLTEVVIPDSITIIPQNAFSYCTNLCKVTIPDTVTSIGSGAFKNTGITSISIPNSVTRIGDNAFKGCDSLAFQIYDTACYLGNNENPYLVLVKASSESITSCTIHPDTTLVISPAFQNCKSLTEIVVPNKVRDFGGYAFQNCSNLEKI